MPKQISHTNKFANKTGLDQNGRLNVVFSVIKLVLGAGSYLYILRHGKAWFWCSACIMEDFKNDWGPLNAIEVIRKKQQNVSRDNVQALTNIQA